jgi:enoyl-CoA hydratase
VQYVTYEVNPTGIAIISLDRPEKANAQHYPLLHELDACWTEADADESVRVIVVRSNGRHFSAGHDMSGPVDDDQTVSAVIDGKWDASRLYINEQKVYLNYCLRWRNVSKPSIAAVQGKCIGGGLMLCWPCDLIIAAENAEFSDPVVKMGISGVEYHAHTWEFGARRAKELLFTGANLDAATAHAIGMVSRVVPVDQLDSATLELATTIAAQDPFALRQAKRVVNSTTNIQGFENALQAAFDIHSVCHGAALSRTGRPSLTPLERMKELNRSES